MTIPQFALTGCVYLNSLEEQISLFKSPSVLKTEKCYFLNTDLPLGLQLSQCKVPE